MRFTTYAPTGGQAQRILEEGLAEQGGYPFDLAIADLNTSPTGAVELVRFIRGNDSLSKLPVIVLSANATVETVQELSGLGIAGLLLKPVSPSDLAEKVCDTLQRMEPLRKGRLAG